MENITKITFKQFIFEGGAATARAGTTRATRQDIEHAIKFVSSVTKIPLADIEANLLGSTPHVLSGLKPDSGDVDIAFEDGKYDRQKIVQAMSRAVGEMPVRVGGNTYSYAVPTLDGKKVQVDLMFFPSEKWARWIHHVDPKSRYKGMVRNALLRAVALHLHDDGKDLVVTDPAGNTVVKIKRALKNDEGLIRLHKVARPRQDGRGRTKALVSASEKEIKAALRELGIENAQFSMEKEQLLEPDKVAQKLFGKGTRAQDLMSAEQVARKILNLKNAREIVKTALSELTPEQLPVELRHLVS